MKAYWDFKPGTWWAYKDSAGGAIDTIKVIARTNHTFTGVINYNNQNATCEYLEIDTYNTGDGYNYNYWINTQDAGSKYTDANEVWGNKFNSSNFIDTHSAFVYPLLIGNVTDNFYGIGADDTCIIKNIYPTFQSYSNVVEVLETINQFENGNKTLTYYAKNIGRVRYEVPATNTVKTLINYNIVQ